MPLRIAATWHLREQKRRVLLSAMKNAPHSSHVFSMVRKQKGPGKCRLLSDASQARVLLVLWLVRLGELPSADFATCILSVYSLVCRRSWRGCAPRQVQFSRYSACPVRSNGRYGNGLDSMADTSQICPAAISEPITSTVKITRRPMPVPSCKCVCHCEPSPLPSGAPVGSLWACVGVSLGNTRSASVLPSAMR
jgi:hypothetical protein